MTYSDLLTHLPRVTSEESVRLKAIMSKLSLLEQEQFAALYTSRRMDPQMVLILNLLGFLGVAGIHRFVTKDFGLGIAYVLTGGFCWIGVIVDAVRHLRISDQHNTAMMNEVLILMGRGVVPPR